MFGRLFSRAGANGSTVEGPEKLSQDAELQGELAAINRVQALIHFSPDGMILDANENFLSTMDYRIDEIKGKHHRIFVDPTYAQSTEYREFWARLGRGEFERGEFKRLGKGQKEVWLLASYNPVFDERGRITKVVKFATDVTSEKLRNANNEGQITAIHRVQGVIEFDLQGTVLTANPLFLQLMGYSLSEIQGQHHSMFVVPGEEKTEAYRQFWSSLREGKPDARVYQRVGKNGKKVWIQASYNPILGLDGRPFKVVKFASDLTELIEQTEQTQRTAESVAAATEEMSLSIAEISKNMSLSREATNMIMTTTQASGSQASTLLETMKSMERIVGIIRGIAGQVNMLALNATIEAARAGEAGKGFAVVASEVKKLSDETAQATNQIGREIGSVQQISARVAESIEKTLVEVRQVDQYVGSVAAAMEQQTAVTKDISGHTTRMVGAVETILQSTRRDTGSH